MLPASTTRLILREADESDAAFMLNLLTEPSWKRFIRQHDVDSETLALEYLNTRIISAYGEGYGFWVVQLRDSGEAIGVCGLIKRDYLPQADIGFAFLEEHWSKGYAEEAARTTIEHTFESLELPCLSAVTIPENSQSIRLLEKLDFQFSLEMTDPNDELVAVYEIRKQ